jgi:hypothetical protein
MQRSEPGTRQEKNEIPPAWAHCSNLFGLNSWRCAANHPVCVTPDHPRGWDDAVNDNRERTCTDGFEHDDELSAVSAQGSLAPSPLKARTAERLLGPAKPGGV